MDKIRNNPDLAEDAKTTFASTDEVDLTDIGFFEQSPEMACLRDDKDIKRQAKTQADEGVDKILDKDSKYNEAKREYNNLPEKVKNKFEKTGIIPTNNSEYEGIIQEFIKQDRLKKAAELAATQAEQAYQAAVTNFDNFTSFAPNAVSLGANCLANQEKN